MRHPSCPSELKILVADMLSAHDAYIQGHQKLFDANEEQFLSLPGEIVEAYLENRSIWDELNHYKQTGSLLGKHRIFSWLNRQREIRGMKIADLVNLKIRLENNLVRSRAAMRRDPKHPLTIKRKERIADQEKQLAEVNTLLNMR